MATDQIEIQIPKTRIMEGTAFTATAYFRDRASAAADAPTTIKYRVDCLATGAEIADWTTVTPGETASIAITATHNAIQDDTNDFEWKQLTVASDFELATQCRKTVRWRVENLYGSP